MGFLSRFEGRMEDTFEGAADKMFDAPISPVQIAKKAEKQMRREKMVGAGKQYAPTLYTVLVNPDDDRRLMGYYPTLAGETETYLTAKASEQGLVMDGQPLVRFIVGADLKHGKFDIIAEAVAAPIIAQLRAEEMHRYGLVAAPPPRRGRPPVIGSTPTWGTRLTKVTAAFGVRPVAVGGVPDILPVPRGSVVLQPGTVRSGFVLGDSFEILGEERLRYIIGAAGLHPCTGAVIDVTGLAGRAAPIHAFGSTGHVFSRGRDGESLHAAGRQYDRRQHRDAPKGRTLPRGTPVSHRSRHFRAPPCICSSPDSTTGDASPRNHDIHHP